MTDAPRPTDNAVFGPLMGGSPDATYGGVLSFMRRRYSRDLADVDAVVWGIPFDQAVSNRPGARFGPSAIRRASAIFDGDPQYPFGFDPFETLAVIDYGDAAFDYTRPQGFADTIAAQAAGIITGEAQLFSLGGDHFVTYPLLKAHAARHGRLALMQFDAHQDTWPDHGGISHGGFVARAVREGLIDPARSIQVGIRTVAPEDCGIPHRPRPRPRYARHRRRHRPHPRGGRRHAGLPHLRYRLPRPGFRPRHRHAGRRAASPAARRSPSSAASGRSTSSAAT